MAFIGAGSVEFTRNVVTDLCGYPELSGKLEVSLHDISPPRLEHALALARAHVGPHEVGYITAHGSSTRRNARTETLALKQVLGQSA